MTRTETLDFAASIRDVVSDHAVNQRWSPAEPGDDTNPTLETHLAKVGWNELGDHLDDVPFLGRAAFELGRGAVSLDVIDRLLGGSPLVTGMTRYAKVGDRVVVPGPEGLDTATVAAASQVPYGDAIGACIVEVSDRTPVDPVRALVQETSWATATVGYLAGLVSRSCELALDHAANRTAFGGPLIQIESVQQRLADAALDRDGLRLLASGHADLDALAFAGPAACDAVAQCHQVLGALGFTLEYPLQVYSRRINSVASWSGAWIGARS